VPQPDDSGLVASVPRPLPRLDEFGVWVEIGEDERDVGHVRCYPTPMWAAAIGVGGDVGAGRGPLRAEVRAALTATKARVYECGVPGLHLRRC